MKFVVIVQNKHNCRVFGPYRSFKTADANARIWRGFVQEMEDKDSTENPWDADFKENMQNKA